MDHFRRVNNEMKTFNCLAILSPERCWIPSSFIPDCQWISIIKQTVHCSSLTRGIFGRIIFFGIVSICDGSRIHSSKYTIFAHIVWSNNNAQQIIRPSKVVVTFYFLGTNILTGKLVTHFQRNVLLCLHSQTPETSFILRRKNSFLKELHTWRFFFFFSVYAINGFSFLLSFIVFVKDLKRTKNEFNLTETDSHPSFIILILLVSSAALMHLWVRHTS